MHHSTNSPATNILLPNLAMAHLELVGKSHHGCIVLLLLLSCLCGVPSQNTTRVATTDPAQARALNSILEKWGKPADTKQWNTTGDPCSGKAIDDSANIEDNTYNPFIKCDCSFNDNTTCYITALKVYSLDAVGEVPDELWTLVYLTNLKISQNYLTGQISPAIGNLTRMQWLDIAKNAFHGPIPKELGKLTELRSLGMGTNNFSGSLPPELGNLRNLEQLYIVGSGVISGEIPSTFANLKSLQILWASGIELTGKIPEYIGNWSKLQTLRLEGNAFTGPIPSSFSTLTSLKDLRISGLSNSSSSLDFVTNLKSLTILVLKNNNMTGSIPNSIGEIQNLLQLDLSFNKLTGQIPNSVFNLAFLSYLFLGNNKFTGNLSTQKSSSLLNIDVSYNQLSGDLPSWVSEQNLQLNLVANNFSEESENIRALPSGLTCLQNGFPCNNGVGRYSDFAIKCGGPQIKSENGVVYEKENEALGPATYFVSENNRWAVSNVGLFSSNSNATYTFQSSRQFTSLDSELFQTTRLSAGSLRYYGLGLQNGNYSVLLQFAELQFENGETWKSIGQRIFDVYIQGNRVEKDFNIRDETGGQSFVPVMKRYTAWVTANYLEIHLFWAGKGTCCVPRQSTYGPSISAISVTPLFEPRPVSSTSKTHTAVIVGTVVPVVTIVLLSLAAYWYIQSKKRSRTKDNELLGIDAKPYTFSYAELKSATGDFSLSNKLGEGGFGSVYKGTLNDGRLVAVKLLSVGSHQGRDQFVAEIATISTVQHRNLVKLYGCSIDGGKRSLVYEYLENKSLDKALFGDGNPKLVWDKRLEICVGVARGLAYLHQESRIRIVHRDVKASNILLDSDLNPKISDFGLAKLYDDKNTHISTRVAGTIGYLAPEYAMRGLLTEKVDVFGFGILALEILSGRSNSDTTLEKEKIYLLEWAWHLYESDQDVELVDKRLSKFNEDEVKRVIKIAFLCTQTSPAQRPTMSRVVAMLIGDMEVIPVKSKPTYLAEWRFDGTSFTTTSTFEAFKSASPSESTTLMNNSPLEKSP